MANLKFILVVLFGILSTVSASAMTNFPVADIQLNGKSYRLEIADNAHRKTQGLMFRTTLAPDAGMLFVYDEPQQLNIWMKNTLIPLAVLWLDEQATIIDIRILYPCRTQHCPSYGPQQQSQYVVELHPTAYRLFKAGDSLSGIKQWHTQLANTHRNKN